MLEDLKLLLGINGKDLDEMLMVIIRSVRDRLLVLLGGTGDVPESLLYIVTEVSAIRYNRIGSEGMTAHSVERESVSYSDNDFAGFMPEIEAWRDEQSETRRGRVRFLCATTRQFTSSALSRANTTNRRATMAMTPSRKPLCMRPS